VDTGFRKRSRANKKRAAQAWMQFQGRFSTRPILRTELLDKLRERMVELVQNKLRW
jgi:hypothetical protein